MADEHTRVLTCAALSGGIAFLILWACGWYIAQQGDPSQWHFMGRYFHVVGSFGAAVFGGLYGYIDRGLS